MRGSTGGVLMEFGAAEVPPPPSSAAMKMTAASDAAATGKRVDSASSLSSTVYEDDTSDAPVGATTTASSSSSSSAVSSSSTGSAVATTAAGFEPSKFFRFADFGARGDGDFFSPGDAGDNNEILPPRTASPTNQTTHDSGAATANGADAAVGGSLPPPALGARGVSASAVPSSSSAAAARARVSVLAGGRRKNSIEMFLSQSPSQALGGGFLKMALDDDHPHPPAPPAHRLPPRRHDLPSAVGSAGARGASVVAISQQPVPTSQPLELDPRDGERGLGKDPSAVSSSAVPTAASGSYGYLLSHSPPAVDTDDEWSSTSSQEMLGGASSSSAAAYYYAESQAALHHQPQQSQSQPPPQTYGYGASSGSNYRYGSDAYGASAGRQQQPPQVAQHHSSWGSSVSPSITHSPYGAPTQSPYSMQSLNASVPSGFAHYQQQPSQQQQQQQAPTHQYHQQHHVQQQSQSMYHSQPQHQQQHHGHRAPVQRGYGRSQSMYGSSSSSSSRMMMMESSPPPSPHTSVGGHYGVKQCKFFLQGHCRMGNKCKFAHHQPQQHSTSAYHSQHQHQPQQQQSYHVAHASPAGSPHHQQHHSGLAPLHGGHDFDSFSSSSTSSTPSSYMSRGASSRSSYRMGGGEMHHQQSSATLTMAPHPAAHHALGGLPGSSLAMAVGAAQVAPVDAMLKIEDVQGRVFSMSKDQNGCRLLQEQLEYYDERKALCDLIYAEAMDHLAEMMVDPFGNYLFQKLLERAKPLQRLEIVRRVSGHLVAAALNLHGTRSVQKVVEVCATSAQVVELASDGSELRRVNLPDLIVEALKDDAVRLCIDSNGNHVIQRALQFMKPEYNQFVFDAVCKECTTVGTHRHGCCVLQRCLDAANDQQKREVITQVEKQAMKLMQDPYGNYVVQYVLDSCTAEEAYGVIVKPLGSVFELSVQKFSSNVIEKCLEKAPPAVLKEYVEEITLCPKMQKMLQDQFANYVVQRALSVSAEDQCLALVKAIRPHLPAMKNTSGGRRITARILKRFPHMDLNLDLGFEPAALGASYAMGGMSMQSYAPQPHHHHHHHQSPPHHHYDASYSMPFASPPGAGSLGLGLHGGAPMMNNGGNGGRM